MKKNKTSQLSKCKRCGTCCKKGGPSFHHEDMHLIEKGVIPLAYLYTIRKGELAHDNVVNHIAPVSSDIIKIKSHEGYATCIFYNSKGCSIYKSRPFECRTLKCWDTSEFEQIYSENRINRKDLISAIEGLWDLIEDHQSHCSYNTINHLLKSLDQEHKEGIRKEILEIIKYDAHIRSIVIEKSKISPEMINFLFGRPLLETIKGFGYKVQKEGEKYQLIRMAQSA